MELSYYVRNRKVECVIVAIVLVGIAFLASTTGWLFSQCMTLFVGCTVAIMVQDDGFTDLAKSSMFVLLIAMIAAFF